MLQNTQVERFEDVEITVEDEDSTLNLSLPGDRLPPSPSFGNNVSSPKQTVENFATPRSATPSPNLLCHSGQNEQLSSSGSSTASPNSERQLSTASPVIQSRLHCPDKTKLKTESWEKWPHINSPGSDSDVSHDDKEQLNTAVPHAEPQIDSSPRKDHQIGIPSPVTPDHDRFSALSPDIEWETLSPNIEQQKPSPDNWSMFKSASPDLKDKSSSAGNQRHQATPSPMLVDHRQLTTPSPMSVSSEEYDGSDSTSHRSESNKSAPHSSTGSSKTPISSITISKPVVDSNVNSNFGTNLANDSGFGSATVSPLVDTIETPHNRTIDLSSSPESIVKDYKTSKYNGKDVIDLTSPKKNDSTIKETFYFGGLTDEIAETMTASEIEAALSGPSNPDLTSVKNSGDSVCIIPQSYSSSFSASTNANKVIAHPSFAASRHSTLLPSKGSAPSTSSCAYNNCGKNVSVGTFSHGKKSMAPATISRPPASPPGDATNGDATNMQPVSSHFSTSNPALPLSSNAKTFKDNTSTFLDTCEKYCGAYETFPNIENSLNTSATSLNGSKQENYVTCTSHDPDIQFAKTVEINKVEGNNKEGATLGKLAKTAVETNQKQENEEKNGSIEQLVDFLRLVFSVTYLRAVKCLYVHVKYKAIKKETLF